MDTRPFVCKFEINLLNSIDRNLFKTAHFCKTPPTDRLTLVLRELTDEELEEVSSVQQKECLLR